MAAQSKSKPLLALKTRQGELTLPLAKAVWLVYRVASYPLLIALTAYLYGTEAAVFAGVVLLMTYRGRL